MKAVFIFIALFVGLFVHANAQTSTVKTNDGGGVTWEIPFASEGNTISLNVQNNSSFEAKKVSVALTNLPSFLEFKSSTGMIKKIPANGSGEAEFTFSVDKNAPVGKDTTLTAVISTSDRQTWTKDITVTIAAPKDYKLYNNFPNPFNPSTKIAFELPKASHVSLIIYDVVGREVARIADGEYTAGYTELSWNGASRNGQHVSSGVYFYRITADKWDKIMKMILIK